MNTRQARGDSEVACFISKVLSGEDMPNGGRILCMRLKARAGSNAAWCEYQELIQEVTDTTVMCLSARPREAWAEAFEALACAYVAVEQADRTWLPAYPLWNNQPLRGSASSCHTA